jgi:hypothetical protein
MWLLELITRIGLPDGALACWSLLRGFLPWLGLAPLLGCMRVLPLLALRLSALEGTSASSIISSTCRPIKDNEKNNT